MRQRTRTRRLLRSCALVLLALVVGTLVLAASRNLWGPAALRAALRRAGFEAEIAATRGVWWGGIEVAGLQLRGAPSALVRELAIDELALEYELSALLRGDLAGLHAIRARGVRGTLALGSAPRNADGWTSSAFVWPPRWPRAAIDGLDLSIELGGARHIELASASLAVEPEQATTAATVAIARVRYLDRERVIAAPLDAHLEYLGAGRFAVDELVLGDLLRIDDATLDLGAIGTGGGEVALSFAALGGSGRLSASLAQGSLAWDLEARAVDLARLSDLIALAPESALGGRIDLAAAGALPIAYPERVAGEAWIETVEPRFGARSAELLRGRLRVRREQFELSEFVLIQAPNEIEVPYLRLPRLPHERSARCPLWEGAQGTFAIAVGDLPAVLARRLAAEDAPALPPHRVVLAGSVRDGLVELARGELSTAGGEIVVERGSLPLAENWPDFLAERDLDLALHVRFADLAPLGAILATPPWEGRLNAVIEIAGSATGPGGSATLRGLGVRFAGRPLGDLAIDARIDRERVTLERCSARGENGSIEAHVRYDFADRSIEITALEARVEDLSLYAPKILPRGALQISGEAAGVWPALDGNVEAHAVGLDLSGLVPGALVLDRAHLSARRVSGKFFVDELDVASAEGVLSAAGTIERTSEPSWKFGVERLAVTRSGSTLELARPVELAWAADVLRSDEIDLAGSAGRAIATLDIRRGTGGVRAHFASFDPQALIAPFLPELVGVSAIDGDLDVDWSAQGVRFAAALEVGAFELAPGRPPARLAVRARLGDERLFLDELALVADGEVLLEAAGEIPLTTRGRVAPGPGPLKFRAHLALPDVAEIAVPWLRERLRGRGLEGDLDGSIDLAGTWSDVSGTLALSSSGIELRGAEDLPIFPTSAVRVRLVLGPTIAIEEATLDGPGALDMSVSGRIEAKPDVAAYFEKGRAAYTDAPLALTARVEALDLAEAEEFIPALRRLGGRASGTLSISGTVGEPEVEGTLAIEAGELRTTTVLPSLAGVEGRLSLQGDRIQIERLAGELGGAPFELTGELGLWGKDKSVDLYLEGGNLLVYRESGVTIRADAQVSIAGPPDALVARGELYLRDSRFARDFDFLQAARGGGSPTAVRGITLFSLDEEPFSNMRFDIAVTSSEPFEIDNNMARGTLHPDLRLEGTGALPVLRGTILVDRMRVSLPATLVRVRSGTIEFLPGRPYVPELELQAEARTQGYEVTIRVSGPYDQPVVDLSSVPPLSHEDLLLLVLTGRPPGEAWSARTSERAAQEVAVFLARDVFSDIFGGSGDGGGGEALTERLEIYQGEDVSRSGEESTQVLFRLTDDIWFANDALYISGERDVYEHYNAGLRVVFRFP